MKLLPINKRYQQKCFFCQTMPVKYEVTLFDKRKVYVCNKCVLTQRSKWRCDVNE